MTVYFFNQEIWPNIHDAATYLEAHGHLVRSATTLEEAQVCLEQGLPDVLVIGIWLRHVDVYQVMRLVRRHDTESSIHVVLLTFMNAGGEPTRNWPDLFDSYVLANADHWQIILAVEQFQFLTVVRRNS